ncbi:MAG: carboxypeptidase-like regulatory domain-containing protein, partial [Pedobacter sp.]
MKINLQKNFAFRKIMKITLSQIVIAFLFTGISFAEKSNAQAVLNQIVSISVNGARLSSALKQIEKDANVKFVYSKNVVKIDQNVSIQATDQKLSVVLDMLLNSNGIAYEAFDNRIVLSNKRDEIFSNISEEGGKNTEETAQFVVTGKVTDRDGQPLIGVSVKVKGTGIGASTDVNGQYSLTLPDGNGALVFTYIGFITQEISVNNQTTINVSLQEDAQSLGEVVVVAYGMQKKATVTGAISSIQTKEIKQSPAANLAVTLAGRLPGLTAIQTSGEPGKDVTLLYLRGRGTINGQNPIILVDRVPSDIT